VALDVAVGATMGTGTVHDAVAQAQAVRSIEAGSGEFDEVRVPSKSAQIERKSNPRRWSLGALPQTPGFSEAWPKAPE
jgi:hypothetical protein